MIAINITHDDDNAVGLLAMAMVTKLAKARAKGRSGWDTPECTQQHLSNLLREHVAKGDPVDVANFCAFLTARGESIAPEQTTVYHCPHCGVLSDSPASTTAAAAPRAHPMKPSDLINSAGIIASDGPGEVVRKLDAAFDAAMVAAVAGPARVVGYFSYDNECGFERHETAQKAQDEAEETLRLFRTDAGAYGWSPEVVSVCWGVILGEAVERPVKDAPHMAGILGSDMEPVDYVLEPLAAPALEAPAAPAVPLKATPEMRAAFRHAYRKGAYREREIWSNRVDYALDQMLAAAPQEPAAPVDDLAQLVKQLVRALRKALPGNDLADKALDYLKRQGLQGSPLRATPEAPQTHAGLLAAAAHIQAKAQAHLDERGSYDPDTGAVEMSESNQEHFNTLDELAEELRELADKSAQAACDKPPAGWTCSRAPGHDGPCAAAPAAPAVDAKAHDWRENASYGGEICAECGAAKGSRRGNAPCAWPPEPLDVCTDPYNCARCKAHPNHRKGLEHAGISRPRSAAQAKEGGAPVADAAPLDVCTDPYNCARCKTHPAHRGDMHHAGISRIGGSA